MGKAKRWLCLVLAAATLLLCACSNTEDDSGPNSGPLGTNGEGLGSGTGRWLEVDVTPEDFEDGLRCFTLADGRLIAYDQGLKHKWESTDGGENWTKTDGPGAADERYKDVSEFTMLEDGSLIVALQNMDTMSVTGLEKISPDGSAEPYPVEALDKAIAEGKNPYIMQLEALGQNRLLLHFGGGGGMAIAGGGPEDEDADTDTDAPEGDGEAAPAGGGKRVVMNATGPTGGQPEGEAEASGPEANDTQQAPPGAEADGDEAGGDEAAEAGGGTFDFNAAADYFDYTLLLDAATGGVVHDFKDSGAMSFTADGERLYLLGYDNKLAAYSLADGKPDASVTGSFGEGGENAFNQKLAAGPNGSLLMCDGNRIQSLAADGTVQGVMDGSSYSFGDPTSYVSGFASTQDGGILMGLHQRDEGLRIYKYSYDPNAELDPTKLVKVWSLEDNFNARAAISLFRRQNPEVTVDYEVALTGEGGLTAEDAIKNLNTRLLNGDGPDVMILDGCPVESYAAKGVLADLAALLDTGDVYPAILEPFMQGGKLFTLPMEFSVPMLIGQQDQLKALSSLDAVMNAITQGKGIAATGENDAFSALPEEERPAFDFGELRDVFDLLWNTSAGAVVKDNAVDNAALSKLLTALKAINDKYELSSDKPSMMAGIALASEGSASVSLSGSPIAYSAQRALYGGFIANDLQLTQIMTEAPGSGQVVFPGLNTGAWMPGCLAGINADSQVTELAAGLLQAMLGQDAQAVTMSGGLPVTKKGAAAEIAAIDKQMRESRRQMSGGANLPEGFEFDFDSLINQLDAPVLNDGTLTDTLWGITEKLCQGELDVEGAVKQFEQESKNYLAERQQ